MGFIHPDYHSIPDRQRPLTPLEALLRSAPGDAIEESQIELLELRDLLADALEELDDIEREAVLATVVERVPLRHKQIPKPKDPTTNYSKSGVAKIRDRAFQKLRRRLENEPLVLQHIATNHAIKEEAEDDEASTDNWAA